MDRLLAVGIVGTVLTALCCFTPLLVVVTGAMGLGMAAWLDAVLLPALFVFVALTLYALVRRHRARRDDNPTHGTRA